MPRVARGAKRCGARLRKSGKLCRRWAAVGKKRCWKCGEGSDKRVRAGKRKPAGRPVVTGNYADPDRTRYGRLAELLEEAKADPAALRTADGELALVKAVLRWQYEKLLAGQWDVMKTPELEEHPGTWLIEAGAKVVDKVAKFNAMIDRDRVQGLLSLVDPVINVVLATIEQFVTEDRKSEAREFVRKKLGQVLVTTG